MWLKTFFSLWLLGASSCFAVLHMEADEVEYHSGKTYLTGHVFFLFEEQVSVKASKAFVGEDRSLELEGEVVFTAPAYELVLQAEKAKVNYPISRIDLENKVVVQREGLLVVGEKAVCTVFQGQPVSFHLFGQGCSVQQEPIETMCFKEAIFDVQEQKATFVAPVGVLCWQEQKAPFKADWMKVEMSKKSKILLDGHVALTAERGELTTTGPLIVLYNSEEKGIDQLVIDGKTHMHVTKEPQLDLEIEGHLFYDQKRGRIQVESTKEEGFSLRHERGVLVAKEALLTLQEDDVLTLNSADIRGDVYATHALAQQNKDQVLQSLFAQRALLYPQEKRLELFSGVTDRVLVFDEINGVKMSAPQVFVQWGEERGEERVEGFGDVRFSFNQDEIKKIYEYLKSR